MSLLLLQSGALLDGIDQRTERDKKPLPRSRSRSESLGSFCPKSGSVDTASARRRSASNGVGDGDGNTPLDLLSLDLRPELKTAREAGQGGDVYSFGKADFFLGYDSFGKANVIRPRRVEALANLQVVRVAASK